MYILNGVKLNLNDELLKKYGCLIGTDIHTPHFDNTLARIAKILLKTESFEKVISLYREDIVAKKIMIAIEDELNTFSLKID